MDKSLFFRGLATLLFFLFLQTHIARGNNIAGGELIYEWLSDSTYRFYVTLYRDCSGSAEPGTMPLCFKNSCTGGGFNVTMTKFAGGGQVFVPSCNYKTKCDSAGATTPGYIKWIYAATVTLPSRCNAWKFFTYVNTRNASTNIVTASKPLYLEGSFNNVGSYQYNSSPYFSLSALPYVCNNEPYSYNNGAIDANADSMVTEVIAPLTGVSPAQMCRPQQLTLALHLYSICPLTPFRQTTLLR